jgi:TPP-dependent trihydroxycyclohexane-1,2-dione (THcHDO) dehydratase
MVNNTLRLVKQQTVTNYLSPQTIEHNKEQHMVLEIQILARERHKNIVGLNR